MKKHVLRLLILVVALFSLASFVPSVNAHTSTPHHASNQCYGESCDGVNPPCATGNETLVNEKTLYDGHGLAIGHLDLFQSTGSNNCRAWSVGLKNIQQPGYVFIANNVATYETGSDNSTGGRCCGETSGWIMYGGDWYSSRMVGEVTNGSACYHGWSDIQDPVTGNQLYTNTNTYCY